MGPTLIANKYALCEKLGSGSFGEVRRGRNVENCTDVAIKLEEAKTDNPQLLLESRVYELIQGAPGIPEVYYYGTCFRYNMMVMQLLGMSIEGALQKNPRKRFDVLTTVTIGIQMTDLLRYLHDKCFIHRDVKPDNFVFGIGDQEDQVFLIDLGLSKKFKSSRTGEHIAYREGKDLTGTARYASINTHRGCEQSRRDDLESLGYVLMYCLRGSLPWQGLNVKIGEDRYERIMDAKMSTPVRELCKGYPNEFADYLVMARSLKFEYRPDYESMKRALRAVAAEKCGVNLEGQKTPNGMSLKEMSRKATVALSS